MKTKEKSLNLILFFLTIGYVSFGLSMPVLNEQIVLSYGSKGLAIEKLVLLISTAVTCSCWKYVKAREVMKKTFLRIYIMSLISTIIMIMVVIEEFIPIVFFACHLVGYCILIPYVLRAIIGLRAWFLADPAEREDYDNSKNLWSSLGGLIGFGVSSLFVIPLKISLILYLVSMVDIIGWIYVYIKYRKDFNQNIPFKKINS